jgi:hypothetical protein
MNAESIIIGLIGLSALLINSCTMFFKLVELRQDEKSKIDVEAPIRFHFVSVLLLMLSVLLCCAFRSS